MRRNITICILIALASALIITAGSGCSSKSDARNETDSATAKVVEEANSNLPRMLDLGSTSCIPCKKMAPILDSLESVYAGKAEIIFIDVRQDKESARKYGITMIPTQIFFDARGNEIYRHIGFFPADSIDAHLKASGASL
jgi:thioredoxin 1